MVFFDDFLYFLKIKIFFFWIHQNYLVALMVETLFNNAFERQTI